MSHDLKYNPPLIHTEDEKPKCSTSKRYRLVVWLVWLSILILILSIALPLAYYIFNTRSSTLLIQATVLHRQEIKILYQMPSITITASDIQKGYLYIPGATKLSIYDNNQSGYALLFEGLNWPFNKALVQGLDREIQISLHSAFIHQPYRKIPITETLSYRFNLADNAKPGEYEWPLSVSLSPIP
jgi:hypothetical protein